eukprot:m.538980 g.538980  ORF g.538980 m.538980 type:complete len:178 (+) comp22086_c0_seq11:296-829(+)
MELLYDLVFAADEADESKDLLLQEKIRKLRWVRAEHLHAKCDPDDPVVRKAFENAQDNLILMDSQRAPLDKLHRVVTASKTIFDLLSKGGSGSAVGADDFMPVLIYAIIKANPPMLYSNLQYVTRFCNPDKLNSGEVRLVARSHAPARCMHESATVGLRWLRWWYRFGSSIDVEWAV